MLFVGDSILDHANINSIAKVTGANITTSKAYSAYHNRISHGLKEPSKIPLRNFLSVVPEEVTKDAYDYLIVQSGAEDITNLKTKINPNENMDYFKQETVKSAKNTFDACLLALDRQPSLKNIIILKQTPRYDPHSSDPLSIKPALAEIFNSTLTELWMSCPLKSKIYLGSHNIECSGAIQLARYQHTRSGRFDGVHLFGPSGSKAYTSSVINVLRASSSGVIPSTNNHTQGNY